MMYSYPFFSFPHFRRYSSYHPSQLPVVKQPISTYYSSTNNHSNFHSKLNDESSKSHIQEKSSPKKAPTGFSFLNHFLHQEDRQEEEEFFNLFGLKLYHDDILLIGLIFFLYQEDVKDQYLFFALILLLLS